MPHKLYSLFLFLLLAQFGGAQNLVPNPSFEDTLDCPNAFNQVYKIAEWSSYGSSPDYFNTCASNPVGVPLNAWGYQLPYNGNAYAFIITYEGMNFTEYREFIGCRLLQALTPGSKYFVSAYISRPDFYPSNGASNNLGFRFSSIPYTAVNPAPIDNFSQVHSASIISDSINWTRISGSFITDSAYEYFIIGNFYDNEHTDTLDINNNDAGYFVDAVCVSTDSLAYLDVKGLATSYSSSKEVSVFPNPVANTINIKGLSASIIYSLVDCFGKTLKQDILIFPQNAIDVSNYSNGLYILELDKKYFIKIIINH